jgi:hypothetical protein
MWCGVCIGSASGGRRVVSHNLCARDAEQGMARVDSRRASQWFDAAPSRPATVLQFSSGVIIGLDATHASPHDQHPASFGYAEGMHMALRLMAGSVLSSWPNPSSLQAG